MVKHFFSRFILLCVILPGTLWQTAQAASINTFVNRQNIEVNESFNLVFEADGSVDADPDFSPLAVYFDILNQSQSSNMTIVNGNFSRKTVWTLVLLAKQPGSYAIPSIEFGKDKSRPLTIKIGKASTQSSSSDQSIFLEAEIDQQSAYVQSQIIYTVRLFRSVDIQNASLTEPELSDADAIVEKIGEDNRYQTRRNGVRYIVIERKYAIFPQQSGQLTIKPLEFNGQIVSQRRSFFDITPFNNVSKRIVSKKINIDVKPVAAIFSDKHWLPSTEVKLQDSWPENVKFKVGEPVTRTISLLASGLTSSQLPDIAQATIENIKQYPDQPTLNNLKDENGIVGIREEKIAFIPTKAGNITLPEINIPWWNTKTGKLQYARIAAKTINVLPGAATQIAVTPAISSTAITQTNNTNTDNFITNPAWIYSTLFFAVLWLLTLGLFFKQKKTNIVQTRVADVVTANNKTRNLSKKFASACHQNNASLCKKLLIEWGQQQWPDVSILSLSDISARLEDDEFGYQVMLLNRSLYSESADSWTADALLTAFEKYKGKPAAKNKDEARNLQSLHKLQ